MTKLYVSVTALYPHSSLLVAQWGAQGGSIQALGPAPLLHSTEEPDQHLRESYTKD